MTSRLGTFTAECVTKNIDTFEDVEELKIELLFDLFYMIMEVNVLCQDTGTIVVFTSPNTLLFSFLVI